MFSIIMPAYNEERHIAEAIQSVLNQDIKDYELLVIDDGSNDDTKKIVCHLVEENKEKITFFQPGKIGKNAAFNLAAEYAKGDWFFFMGADDILPPNALIIWSKAVKHNDPDKKIAIRGRLRMFSNNKRYDGLTLPRNKKVYNWASGLTLISRGMLSEFMPIPTEYPNEDNWTSLHIRFFADELILINDIIYYYRIHDSNSISRTSGFPVFNIKYHARQLVTCEFLERHKNRLSEKEQETLRREIELETYRFSGQTFNILRNLKYGFKPTVRAIFLSNSMLFWIKQKLDRFMLGH